MKVCILTVLACVLVSNSYGQKMQDSTSAKASKVEVFMNVSDALGRAVGNSTSSSFINDQMLFGVKVIRSYDKAIRLGGNFRVTTTGNFIGSTERITRENFYSVFVGLEKRKELSSNLSYYYGIDVRYYLLNSSNQTIFNSFEYSSSINISATENGPGLAPLLGFKWQITPRISLFTEASVTAQYLFVDRFLEDETGKTTLEDKNELRVLPVMPGVIFLSINL